jgi:hypothetical protein
MRDKPNGGRNPRWGLVPLPPDIKAQMSRRMNILLGLVPLPEMTEAETEWRFAQAKRMADDE